MKNRMIFSTVLFMILLSQLSLALPVIENLYLNPASIWLGENVAISLDCSDDVGKEITEVYADIVGPGVILPTLYFEGSYDLTVDDIYLDRIGQFDVTIYCKNVDGEVTDVSNDFTVSQLTGHINSVSPSPSYIGDTIEIDFVVEKDGVPQSSDVNFEVKLNGISKVLSAIPIYDTSRGWILRINSPDVADTYDLEITASYDRTSVSDIDSVVVNSFVEFEIISLDKEWVGLNDEVVIKIRALEKGYLIDLDENNLDIKIQSTQLEIEEIASNNNLFDVVVKIPALSSGKYDLEVILDHNSISYTDSKDVFYVVSISGQIADEDDKGLGAQIEFIQDDVVKFDITTDDSGHYSGSIAPDIYDVKITLPDIEIYLESASVSSFYDPIKYSYHSDVIVPGIRSVGVHSIEIDLNYVTADIKLKYKEKDVEDESELRIFKCSEWNSGKKECDEDWFEISGEVDSVRNVMEITTTGLSAFSIGTIESLEVSFNIDKEKYNLNEDLVVSGIVKDSVGNLVGGVFVVGKIKGTSTSSSDTANSEGVFSLTLAVPEKEDDYVFVLTVEQEPYFNFRGEKSFVVEKSRFVYLNFPDTVKVKRGENFIQKFSVINTGQANLDLNISLSDISDEYFDINLDFVSLEPGEEKENYIEFLIPADFEIGINSISLFVMGEEINERKIFGLNIFEESQIETVPSTGLFTGITIPNFKTNIIYVVVLGLITVVIALILKKLKVSKIKRNNLRSFMSDVKTQLKIDKQITLDSFYYDDIISSEFPGALQKMNRGDKKW